MHNCITIYDILYIFLQYARHSWFSNVFIGRLCDILFAFMPRYI
jgi:hypothetical protein